MMNRFLLLPILTQAEAEELERAKNTLSLSMYLGNIPQDLQQRMAIAWIFGYKVGERFYNLLREETGEYLQSFETERTRTLGKGSLKLNFSRAEAGVFTSQQVEQLISYGCQFQTEEVWEEVASDIEIEIMEKKEEEVEDDIEQENQPSD